MRVSSRLFQASLWLATTSLGLSTAAPAFAQPAPPPDAAGDQGGDQGGDQSGDVPAIAGSLSKITGNVSFHAAGEDRWVAATLNYPVTTGEAFWTEAQAQAEIEIADDRVVMAGSTELDVAQLDQQQFVATEPQGALFVQLNSLQQGQSMTVNTPRGAVQLTGQGRYEIVAGDTNDATTITVVDGSATVTAAGLSLRIGARQTATISGSDTFQGSVGPMQQDDFLASMLRVPAEASAPPEAVRSEVQYMTGGSELASYGSWNQTADYGEVWYPNDVGSDWAPYRDGHWAYVQPWGWTWVDNARWGFAPFHYGRWVQVNDRWGWIAGAPGAPVGGYPVYAPAMVSFVDVGGAALTAAAIGFAAGALLGGYAPCWIPLGPREPYYPWYHTRGDYFARINGRYGVSREIIQRGPTYNVNIHETNVFVNRRAATVMPANAMARGEGVRAAGRPLPVAALRDARPVRGGHLVVPPTAQTPNLTRQVAQRYKVALPAQGARGPAAPGPRILPEAGRAARAPELRSAALPSNVRAVPAAQVRPGPHENAGRPATPGEAPRGGAPQTDRPALRAPGAGRPPTPEIDTHRGEAAREGAPASRAPEARPGPTPGAGFGAAPHAPERSTPSRPAENRPAAAPHEATPRPAPAGHAPVAHAPARHEPIERAPVEHAPRPAEPRPMAPRPEMPRPMVPAFHAPQRPVAPAPRPPAPHPVAPHPEERPRPG